MTFEDYFTFAARCKPIACVLTQRLQQSESDYGTALFRRNQGASTQLCQEVKCGTVMMRRSVVGILPCVHEQLL